MKNKLSILMILFIGQLMAQDIMTPDILLSLSRVSPVGISPDRKLIYYTVGKPNKALDKNETTIYTVNFSSRKTNVIANPGDKATIYQILSDGSLLMTKGNKLILANENGEEVKVILDEIGNKDNFELSPDRKKLIYSEEITLQIINSNKKYNDLPKSDMYIYDDLNYRHWDTWHEGKFNHIYWANIENGKLVSPVDIIGSDQPFDCPQKPFGGTEDFNWDANSENIVYVTKMHFGKAYAISTNTDIFLYNINTRNTTNISKENKGYDTQPAYSHRGTKLAWTAMKTDGYEADKNDIYTFDFISNSRINLTSSWDGTVQDIYWSDDDNYIYFTAPTAGTVQLFKVNIFGTEPVKQISKGPFNINSLIGFVNNEIVVSKQDMNQATELYSFEPNSQEFKSLTFANAETYGKIKPCPIENHIISATDGEDLQVWVIYPPNYDKNKKYPTLLYCQGGPQSEVSQYYSFRWNFQTIASQGYIILAPNRRGLPGFGTKWNQSISGDWGGMPMKDYLQTVDVLTSQISAIDKNRIGAIGASYGGYSVFMLAGIHENRFKTFISHCGLFDLKSWYGSTEEMWFANYDIGGPYWATNPHKSYTAFDPSSHVAKWNTPILIYQGGMDFRVPTEQGLEAFKAAQIQGIKSRLVYLPNENHWVMKNQNALAWQREFFAWLKETL